jgi:tetratricopeptide (TPR) repeat protein
VLAATSPAGPLLMALVGILVISLLLLLLARVFSGRGIWRPVPAALPLGLWACLPLLQVIPLPPAMVHWLSPRAWEFYWQSIWVVQPQTWMPLSLDPPATLDIFFRGAAAWGGYLLAVQVFAGRQRLEGIALLLSGVAALSALLALLRPDLQHTLLLPAMLLPVTFALYLTHRPATDDSRWRDRLGRWLGRPRLNRAMLLLAGMVSMTAALLAGAQRGQGSWSIGFLVFALLLLAHRRRWPWRAGLAVLAVMLVVVTTLPHLGQPLSSIHWRETWRLLTDFPVLGAGSGAWAQLLLQYHFLPKVEVQVPSWMTLAAGIGFGGLLLAGWAMGSWLYATMRCWRQRRNAFAVCLGAGCTGGLLAGLLYGVVPLLLVALLAALATAASLHSSRPPAAGAAPLGRPQAALAMGMLVLLLSGQILLPLLLLPEHLPAQLRQYAPALFYLDRQQTLLDDHLLQGDFHGALQQTATALRLRPLSVPTRWQAAEIFDRLGAEESADRLWLSLAAATPEGPRRFAQRLWQRGSGEAAKAYLRRTLVGSPQRTGEFLPLLEFWGVGHEEMSALLPEEPLAQLALGEFLAARAENDLAVGRFRQAVLLASSTGGGVPDIYERAGEFFHAQGRHPEALEMVQSGLQHFPARSPLRRMAGSLYEKMGIRYRAIEEYRQCLLLDPTDQWSRQRLAILAGD